MQALFKIARHQFLKYVTLYPAATSVLLPAPFGANLNYGFTSISGNASFYYFVSNTNGPLNINIILLM